jgi:hypothetical protein
MSPNSSSEVTLASASVDGAADGATGLGLRIGVKKSA